MNERLNQYATVMRFDPVDGDAKTRSDVSSDYVPQLQSVLDMGLDGTKTSMLLYSKAVQIKRSIARLVDSNMPVPDVSRPTSENGKQEIVVVYDVFMTGRTDSDSQKSISVLSSCVRALAHGRQVQDKSIIPNFRSVIVIHADEPKGAATLNASTIKYIYEQFSGKTEGPNLAAVYVITASVAVQALIGMTTMFTSGLEKVHVYGSRSMVLRRVHARR